MPTIKMFLALPDRRTIIINVTYNTEIGISTLVIASKINIATAVAKNRNQTKRRFAIFMSHLFGGLSLPVIIYWPGLLFVAGLDEVNFVEGAASQLNIQCVALAKPWDSFPQAFAIACKHFHDWKTVAR